MYVCIYMHIKKNLRFIQTHAAAARVERPALSLLGLRFVNPAYVRLSLLHVEPSLVLSYVVALLAVVRVSMFTSSKTIRN